MPARTPRRVGDAGAWSASRFGVLPERSVALIDARSTVGPISFGVIGLTRHRSSAEPATTACASRRAPPLTVDIRVDRLRSGNSLYDAELLPPHRRPAVPDGRRRPARLQRVGLANRYRLEVS